MRRINLKEHCTSGWESFGKSIPASRMTCAYETLKEMIPTLETEVAFSIIGKMATHVEKDRPFQIIGAIEGLDKDLALVDLTGRYRLLAILLSGKVKLKSDKTVTP